MDLIIFLPLLAIPVVIIFCRISWSTIKRYKPEQLHSTRQKLTFFRRWIEVTVNMADVYSDIALLVTFLLDGEITYFALILTIMCLNFVCNIGFTVFRFVFLKDAPWYIKLRVIVTTIFQLSLLQEAVWPTNKDAPDSIMRIMKLTEALVEAIPMAIITLSILLFKPPEGSDVAIIISLSLSILSAGWVVPNGIPVTMYYVQGFEDAWNLQKQAVIMVWSVLDILARVASIAIWVVAFQGKGVVVLLELVVTRLLWHRFNDKEWKYIVSVIFCLTDVTRWIQADWKNNQYPQILEIISWIESAYLVTAGVMFADNETERDHIFMVYTVYFVIASHALKFLVGMYITWKLFPEKWIPRNEAPRMNDVVGENPRALNPLPSIVFARQQFGSHGGTSGLTKPTHIQGSSAVIANLARKSKQPNKPNANNGPKRSALAALISDESPQISSGQTPPKKQTTKSPVRKASSDVQTCKKCNAQPTARGDFCGACGATGS